MFDGSAKGVSDTPPEVERAMIALWRRATPEQRLVKALSIGRFINGPDSV